MDNGYWLLLTNYLECDFIYSIGPENYIYIYIYYTTRIVIHNHNLLKKQRIVIHNLLCSRSNELDTQNKNKNQKTKTLIYHCIGR